MLGAIRGGPAGGLFFGFHIQKKFTLRPFLETTKIFAKKRPLRGRWYYEKGEKPDGLTNSRLQTMIGVL